jgi:uncharacterized protein (DUF2384 family)
MTEMHKPSFYAGVIAALAVVAEHDEETLFDEIIASVDEIALVRAARKAGAMRWSGLSKYGYGRKETKDETA